MDLVNTINILTDRLNVAVKKLIKHGQDLAEKERDYKVTLRKEALKLRSEKGMPVTLISQIIYGVPEVAEKRFARDVAETIYNAEQENINSIKLQIRILESQIQREWGTNDR